jgi:hypothetical protein
LIVTPPNKPTTNPQNMAAADGTQYFINNDNPSNKDMATLVRPTRSSSAT